MDPVTLSIIASVLGNVMGNVRSANANKEAQDYLTGLQKQNEAWYNKNYNTNYLDTEEAKSIIRMVQDEITQQSDNVKSSAAITGASPEKEVAVKERLGRVLNNTLSNLSSRGLQRKDAIESQYLNRKGQLDQAKLGQLSERSASGQQFAQNAMGLGTSAALMKMFGGDSTDGASNIIQKILQNFRYAGGKTTGDKELQFENWMLKPFGT